MTKTFLAETNHQGADRLARYGWTSDIGAGGQLLHIDKRLLRVDAAYQRDVYSAKVREMSRNFSLVAFGALLVMRREGIFFVVDGQHRLAAALRRSDVQNLPCIVFESSGALEEAQAFLVANNNRKAMSSLAKFKASLLAGDPTAVFVHRELERHGVTFVNNVSSPYQIKFAAACMSRAGESKEAFSAVFSLCMDLALSENTPVKERVFGGLWWLHKNLPSPGVEAPAFRSRAKSVAMTKLDMEARKFSLISGAGGEAAWGTGMLGALNVGLRKKIEVAR